MARNEVAVQREANFKNLIGSKEVWGLVKTACGSPAAAKQFAASMLDLYEDGGDRLQNCDQMAVVRECLKAAQLHMPLIKSLGYAYVVPYRGVPTFTIGWKGLVQLAQNTGKYRYINAGAVYEGQEVETDYLTGAIKITGEPANPNAKAIGYFAYIQLLNGFEKSVYMTRAEMEAYGRKYSKTYNDGPWKTEFDAMARKTVLRKVLKYGPASTEMMSVEAGEVKAAENAAQAEVDENANTGEVIDIPEESAPAKQEEDDPIPAPEF